MVRKNKKKTTESLYLKDDKDLQNVAVKIKKNGRAQLPVRFLGAKGQ